MAENCRVRPEGDLSLSLPYHAYLSDSPRPIAINKPRSALSRKFRAEGFQGWRHSLTFKSLIYGCQTTSVLSLFLDITDVIIWLSLAHKLMPLMPAVFVNGEKKRGTVARWPRSHFSGDQQSEAKMFSNTRVACLNILQLHHRSLLLHAKAQDSCWTLFVLIACVFGFVWRGLLLQSIDLQAPLSLRQPQHDCYPEQAPSGAKRKGSTGAYQITWKWQMCGLSGQESRYI